jgi:hypothetical protein
MLVYITVDPVPPGHYRYGLIDTDEYMGDFSDTLSDLEVDRMGDISKETGLWNLKYNTLDELIAHPNVTQFTEDSHPEYFI